MEFKGTKGKWEVMDASRFAVPFIVFNDNDETIFQCYNTKQGNDAQANALLISKAPEMLEMLKNYLADLNNIIPSSDAQRSRIYDIEQLIKEATEI